MRQDLEAKCDGGRAVPLLDAGGGAFGNGVRLAAEEILVIRARAPHECRLRLIEEFRCLVQKDERVLEQPALEPRCAESAQPLDIDKNQEMCIMLEGPGLEAVSPGLEAPPYLDQNLVSKLDSLGRIVERRQQPSCDQAIAQGGECRVLANVGGPTAALRNANPTILEANEMTK